MLCMELMWSRALPCGFSAGCEQNGLLLPAHSITCVPWHLPGAGQGKAPCATPFPRDAPCWAGGHVPAGCRCPAGHWLFPSCMAALNPQGFAAVV